MTASTVPKLESHDCGPDDAHRTLACAYDLCSPGSRQYLLNVARSLAMRDIGADQPALAEGAAALRLVQG